MFCKYDDPELLDDVFKAVKTGNAAALAFYLNDGADPDLRDPSTNMLLLHTAVSEQNAALAEQLFQAGANPSLNGGPSGFTALHFAAYRGNAELTALVLRHQPDIDATAYGLQTPLHLAAHFGRIDVVKALVEAGADIKKQDSRGLTPRAISVERTDATVTLSHQPYMEVTRYLWQKEQELHADLQNDTSAAALHDKLQGHKRPQLRLAPRRK